LAHAVGANAPLLVDVDGQPSQRSFLVVGVVRSWLL
jgi:hypothetical protein